MRSKVGFDAPVVRPVYFVDIDFISGPFRANSSDKNLMMDGNLYTGVGNLGAIGDTTVATGTQAQTIKLTLLSIPAIQVQAIMAENTRNRRLIISVCLFDEAHNILTPPFVIFSGTSDTLQMEIAQAIALQLTATSRLINWARSPNARYTNEDQQAKYPGDKGFQFINQLQTLKLQWGS